MRKNTQLLFIFLFLTTICTSQVGISVNNPNGILDINSSTMGLVYPTVALVATNTETVTNPNAVNIVAGTTVYNTATTNNGINSVYPGIYFWNGSAWIPQYQKDDNRVFVQNANLRTGSSDILNPVLGDQSISFDSNIFNPIYNGTYKVTVTVQYGGGLVNTPTGSQWVNFAKQVGDFDFTFNGTTHSFNHSTYSGSNDDKLFDGGTKKNYTNVLNQTSINFTENLTAGTNYLFTLTFNQENAPGFEGDGDISVIPAGDGRGYIIQSGSMYCTVELNYIGD